MTDDAQTPKPPDPGFLEALLADTQESFTQALVLIDNSLKADFERQPAQALAFRHQIQKLLEEADGRLTLMRSEMGAWDDARKSGYPLELVERVDRFIELLATGLDSVIRRVGEQSAAIDKRREEIRTTLAELGKQKTGLAGYRQKGPRNKLFRDQA